MHLKQCGQLCVQFIECHPGFFISVEFFIFQLSSYILLNEKLQFLISAMLIHLINFNRIENKEIGHYDYS